MRPEMPSFAMAREAALKIAPEGQAPGTSVAEPSQALLDVRGLSVRFDGAPKDVNVVDDVSFSVAKGKTLGIVGESGCGKSVTALALMGLLPTPPARIVAGSASFGGQDLFALSERARADWRGDKIAMIFQEPMTSLNPSFTIGDQIAEGIIRHRKVGKAEAWARALEMLKRVRIPAPEKRLRAYPHELSGGMRQRVMIAMALANDPELLIADEPTTALDVTIQAQILSLVRRLQEESGTAMILITHDLGVVAEAADEVAVMYAGRVVEIGSRGRRLRGSAASLHDRPHGLGAVARPPPGAACDDQGHGALSRADAERMPVRPALPVLGCALRRGSAAADRHQARPQGALLVCTDRTTSGVGA